MVVWLVALMVTPAPLVGIGLARLLNRHGVCGAIYDSPMIVVLVFFVRFLPYQVLATAAGIRAIPAALEEQARQFGAGPLRTLVQITAPLSLKSAAAGAVLVFTLSLGEVGATVLVVSPGTTTLTIHFFTLIHYGVYSDAAAICLTLAATVILVSLVAAATWRRPQ